MSKELVNRISTLSVSLGVALIFALLGADILGALAVYIATLIGLNLSDIASAIRERPLNIYMDKSFLERIIDEFKNRDNEQRD